MKILLSCAPGYALSYKNTLLLHPGNDPYLRALLMEEVFIKASRSNTMSRVRLHDIEFELFITEQDVNAAVDRLAGELRKKYDGKRPLLVGVLNGAFFFAAELMKRLDIECEITFVKVASYHGTSSTGKVSDLIGLNERITDRHVLVLEDIVDTGTTVRHILDALKDHHPASVSIATLLFKPDAYKQPDIEIEHVALSIPNAFVVGSGLDHDGLGRNLPGIYQIIQNGK